MPSYRINVISPSGERLAALSVSEDELREWAPENLAAAIGCQAQQAMNDHLRRMDAA